ncbi:hypothetical protein FGO68_gene416 [Halteria grandinella]|uniref:Uncharacterized protein n=1 Tax=Halteria grandinella TaxID=5974 RepID=A0A8J8NFV0_HALGN|nr:hypothetical protein FGO68_gene416 [Halteria grandinella]
MKLRTKQTLSNLALPTSVQPPYKRLKSNCGVYPLAMANRGSWPSFVSLFLRLVFKKVHMIYDNKHLMERDKADFEDLWWLGECQDMVEHHKLCGFQPQDNSLILIDESDRTTLEVLEPSSTRSLHMFHNHPKQFRSRRS